MGKKANSPFVIVSSGGMHEMAASVREKLAERNPPLSLAHLQVKETRFANQEDHAWIPETVRRQHVFLFHALLEPTPNEAFMRMMIACDALARASVASITLVIPYMSYLRQDRKDRARVPITARLVADMIETNRLIKDIVTIDMHTEQAQGFFRVPVDNLSSKYLFVDYLKKILGEKIDNAVVVAPDFGSAKRAQKFAEALGGLPKSILEKERRGTNVSEVLAVTGEPVKDRVVLMYDDMIDTGGTIVGAAQTLLAPPHGAREVYVMATHGIFSGSAREKLPASGIPIIVTNSIPRSAKYQGNTPWFTTVPIDDLIARALYEHTLVAGSVSKLS